MQPPDDAAPDIVSTGIERLDDLMGGGLPRQSLVAIAGVPGAGKSVLVLHTLAEALHRGYHGLYVTTTHHPVEKLREQYRSLSFLRSEGLIDKLEFFELRPQLQSGELTELLNVVVRRLQEHDTKVVAIDSFRAISDLAPSRGEVWRFLGELCRQLVLADCVCLLVGEYELPRDLDLPEFAMADAILHLEVERNVTSDSRALRIYKMRGSPYSEGRVAFTITADGMQFVE